jgi:hypothetical protein
MLNLVPSDVIVCHTLRKLVQEPFDCGGTAEPSAMIALVMYDYLGKSVGVERTYELSV